MLTGAAVAVDFMDGAMAGRKKKTAGKKPPTRERREPRQQREPDDDPIPLGAAAREPKTQGQRIRWVRHQVGPDFATSMRRSDFARAVAKLAGKQPQSATTYHRWEADVGRGPSLAEGVAIARLGGRSVAWLAGLEGTPTRVVRAAVDAPSAALRTQGDRIKWVRHQLGESPWEPMTQPAFGELIAELSGEGVRAASTIHHWEHDRFDGPTLREAVVIARLVGRTAEWLSALAEDDLDSLKVEMGAPQVPISSRVIDVDDPPGDRVRKQGHGRGRKR